VSDADYEARAAGKRVIISAAEECRVMGNESILRSAIENVLRNAVKYTAEGTEVNVSLSCKEKKALIAVSDEGGGVPDPELENLFKPFYRVGEARDRGSGGTGLGLAIAEQAVKSHKGRISARNNNGGLVVEIELDRVISKWEGAGFSS
ncbi:MAG TPA: two-component sensor histidine kinase, partial [Blastocatellia bacterium]|nr:two-component sensor histidine kinase [Blastocatellia bacterium]